MNYFDAVVDSLNQQIAVIDHSGMIQWVNRSWKEFSEENGGSPAGCGQSANYLSVCSGSANGGDADGKIALDGVEGVIRGDLPQFYFEYPCHSPTTQRWFMMRIRPLLCEGPRHFVVSHQNITERKLAELKVRSLANFDGLTGIANRRYFDEFLADEWRRAQRAGCPLSLVLLDIDFFKPFNDNYGHSEGDECLRRVGAALQTVARRPGDLAARYGGEEFAIVLGDTKAEDAFRIANKARHTIRALNIPHEHATEAGTVTVSAGVATQVLDQQSGSSAAGLIEAADQAMYEAKNSGRNQVFMQAEAEFARAG